MNPPSVENGAKPRVAFIVQRCGLGVNGGAESLCLQVAQQMEASWDIEVLTTCALDYISWKNHFPAGEEQCGSTTIRRFPVATERNIVAFDRLSAELMSRQRLCTLQEQHEWMKAQGPHCPALTDFIRTHRDAYDAFVFFGYLYATTFDNLPLVHEKAWLVPCTHDEWPLNFTMFDRLFSLPRGFIFNTAPERDFTRERFFHLNIGGAVAGIGIDLPQEVAPDRFRLRHKVDGPFLLYCGRIDPSKGCEEMFQAFLQWQRESRRAHKLVLLGNAFMPVPISPDIVALGFVSEGDKLDAMAACDWLVVPSRYESLSMVLLEAWSVGRPALVNADCRVLADHCERSKGGIAFANWLEAFAAVELCSAAETNALGTNGRRYVTTNYTWKAVCEKYRLTLSSAGIESTPVLCKVSEGT